MSKNTHKAAAVPFVNQRGERSMKRVKVERYVAGKKPSYAHDDEDDEYYTTDEEAGEEEQEEEEDLRSQDDSSSQSEPDRKPSVGNVKIDPDASHQIEEIEEELDDDPRFRRLKSIESKPSSAPIDALHQIASVSDYKNVTIIEDEDEDEEEIRQRHLQAQARKVEEPVGLQAISDAWKNDAQDLEQHDNLNQHFKTLQTDDFLKDFQLGGLRRDIEETKAEIEAEEMCKEMIEQARQESILKAQSLKKMEEDLKQDVAKEASKKSDFSARQIDSVNTDDEDEDEAFEAWKVREISRVQRDRIERALLTAR